MKIRIRDLSTGLWLISGGNFSEHKTDAKVFTKIWQATDAGRRAGILDENVYANWELDND